MFVATKYCRRDKYLRKHTFVETKKCVCHRRGKLVMTKHLSWQIYVCSNKSMFVVTNLLSQQKLYLWQLPPMIPPSTLPPFPPPPPPVHNTSMHESSQVYQYLSLSPSLSDVSYTLMSKWQPACTYQAQMQLWSIWIWRSRRGILALLAGDVLLSFNRYLMDGCVTLLVSEFYPEGWMGVNIFSFFLVSGSVPLLLHSLYGSASEHGELTLASSPSIQS